MKNKIILGIGAIIVLGALVWAGRLLPTQKLHLTPVETPALGTASTTIPSIKDVLTLPAIDSNPALIQAAWATFQKYLAFAKAHDLEGVRSLSYQLGATCSDPNKKSECDVIIDSVYSFGIDLEAKDFTHAWYDNKQIIVFTDPIKQEAEDVFGYVHGVLYFVRDSAGNFKLLSFNPSSGVFIKKENLSQAEIEAKTASLLKDTDQDGLEDQIENCEDALSSATCIKTNPNKRDTDGDGWWDGIEVFFNTK